VLFTHLLRRVSRCRRLNNCLLNDPAISASPSEREHAAYLADASTDVGGVAGGMSDLGYNTDDDGAVSTSGARGYTFENSRRYHGFREGCYHFPNDDPEQEREDMTYAMILYLYDRLHFAPIRTNSHRDWIVGDWW
jgi:hypothetical protein